MELKPCAYCNEDNEGFYALLGGFYITNPFHKGEHYLNGGKLKPRKINYCPMCGRDLNSRAKGVI